MTGKGNRGEEKEKEKGKDKDREWGEEANGGERDEGERIGGRREMVEGR